jgi:hypothetical protein
MAYKGRVDPRIGESKMTLSAASVVSVQAFRIKKAAQVLIMDSANREHAILALATLHDAESHIMTVLNITVGEVADYLAAAGK